MTYKKPPKKSRQESNPSSSATGVSLGLEPIIEDFGIVVDTKKVKRQCQKTIENLLGFHSAMLRFKVLEDSTQGFEGLSAVDTNAASQLEGKRFTPLIKWFDQQETTYWIGFRLGFLPLPKGTGRYINTVSLTLARTFSGSQPEAVLRAEWAYYHPEHQITAKKEIVEHAQPHWHIYKSNINQEENQRAAAILQESISTSEVPTEEFVPNAPRVSPSSSDFSGAEDKDLITNFHFAMCAHWNRERPIIQWPISEKELIHWLRHCLSYIRSELESVKS